MLFRTSSIAYGSSQARGLIRATAAGLHQSHSSTGSDLCLQPTPQLTAMPDPPPTERGQGWNPQPHGSQSDSLTTAPQWELLAWLLFTDFYIFIFCFLEPHSWHMEVPSLGVILELQLPAYTTATAMPDLSCICDLHHRSQQRWILNPLSKARN